MGFRKQITYGNTMQMSSHSMNSVAEIIFGV